MGRSFYFAKKIGQRRRGERTRGSGEEPCPEALHDMIEALKAAFLAKRKKRKRKT